jgi:multiple antibiotic resistance protein
VSVFSLAIIFFFVANPIGNSPTILALVKSFPFERQKRIIIREALIALLLAIFFQYGGEGFLSLLHVDSYAVTMCGGVLLFLVALQMIFSQAEKEEAATLKKEPFIVPIATPLLSGPGLLTIIMLKADEVKDNAKITFAILLTWTGVMAVMIIAPYLQKILGKRGLLALEQLMGLVLLMIATDMLVRGMALFINTLS